jgi:hypothetical protein
MCFNSKCFMLWNRCTCHIGFDFVGKNVIVLRTVTFMMQCTKEDSVTGLVNRRIMGPPKKKKKNRTFAVLGTFFLCLTIFFQIFFFCFINGKNCWYSSFSCVSCMKWKA